MIEKNDQLKKQIQQLESQLADVTDENSSLAKNIQTHAELIKTVQLLETRIGRRTDRSQINRI